MEFDTSGILKEFCSFSNWCVIRTETGANHWAYFEQLVEIAQTDFPELQKSSIHIIRYATGDRYAIMFAPPTPIPDGYIKIKLLRQES